MIEKSFSEQELIKQQFVDFVQQVWKPQRFDTGCFGGINKKYWVEFNGKEYLFKFTSGKNDNSDFAEVFVSYLSCLLGFDCINAFFCKDFFSEETEENSENSKSLNQKVEIIKKDNIHFGTLIESYRTKNVIETISLSQLIEKYKRRCPEGGTPTWEVEEICNEFCEDKNLICSPKLGQRLKEMALIDYLLVQIDRGPNNIEFLIKEKRGKKYLTLSPMFDNGFCLHLEELHIDKVLIERLKDSSFSLGSISNPTPNFYIQQKKDYDFFAETDTTVENLAKELLSNKELMALYEKFKDLNILNEINFVKSLYKRNLSQEKEELIELSIKNRINLLEIELAKQIIKKNFKENNDECDFTL